MYCSLAAVIEEVVADARLTSGAAAPREMRKATGFTKEAGAAERPIRVVLHMQAVGVCTPHAVLLHLVPAGGTRLHRNVGPV